MAGTTILSSAVNQNFSDIASGLSDVLTRDGQAGMTAQFKAIAGSVTAPGISFTTDPNTGLYDAAADNPAIAANGVQAQNWTNVSSVQPIGVVESGQLVPTILSADQNNYAPAGIDIASTLYLTSSLTVNITGLAGLNSGPTAPVAGRKIRVFNGNALGSGFNIILKTQNGSSTAANRFSFGGDFTLYPQQMAELIYNGTDSRWNAEATASFQSQSIATPGGRLTVVSGTPIITTNIQNQTTVYYTPYLNAYIYLYDGSVWTLTPFTELSQTLADTTKSPAASAADQNYDMFVWNDLGTLRCTRGPLWSSATARGTGAGTTQLTTVNGIQMNAVSITNGPAASRGVYIGTIRTGTGAGSGVNGVFFVPVAITGSLGGNNVLGIWNMYNRVDVSASSQDSTDSWSYTTATWRAANGSNSNRITVICGLNEDSLTASYTAVGSNSAGTAVISCGVGLDVTNAFSGLPASIVPGNNGPVSFTSNYKGFAGLGLHFFQALEYSTASSTSTWYGDNGAPTVIQMGLSLTWRM